MNDGNRLIFDLSSGQPLASFNHEPMGTPDSAIAYQLLRRFCGVVPAAGMMGIQRVNGDLNIKVCFELNGDGGESPVYIDGHGAHSLYRCIFAPGKDPLLPAIVEVQVNGGPHSQAT